MTELGKQAFQRAVADACAGDDVMMSVTTEDEQGKGEIHRFPAPSNTENVARVRAFIAEHRPRFAAMTYKGFMDDRGEKVHAIFIDLYDREQECGVEMGRGIRPKTKGAEMSFVGEMQVFAEDVPYPAR